MAPTGPALRRLLRRLRYLIRQRRFEADLAEELEHHRALTQRDREAAGLAPTDAAIATRRTLGSAILARDQSRDIWIRPWLRSIVQDTRFAWRLFVTEPWTTVAIVVTLALGIGLNTMVFTILNGLTRGLPIAHADRIMTIRARDAGGGALGMSYLDVQDWRAATRAFTDIAAFSSASLSLQEEGQAAIASPRPISPRTPSA